MKITEDVLLPFMRLRGKIADNSVKIIGVKDHMFLDALLTAINGRNFRFTDYQEQMVAYQEEGDQFLTNGHYRLAANSYTEGLLVAPSFFDAAAELGRPIHISYSTRIQSLSVDLANSFCVASQKLIAKSRNPVDNSLPPQAIHIIGQQIDMYQIAFSLFYISDQQRSQAHHHHAVACENLAEYLNVSGYRDFMIFNVRENLFDRLDQPRRDLLEEATRNYFFA